MRNKKSVLMTLNHNYGYFSGVAGIAGNARVCDVFCKKNVRQTHRYVIFLTF
jgi:hypothetical protein